MMAGRQAALAPRGPGGCRPGGATTLAASHRSRNMTFISPLPFVVFRKPDFANDPRESAVMFCHFCVSRTLGGEIGGRYISGGW